MNTNDYPDSDAALVPSPAPSYVEQNASMVQQYATARLQSAYTMALRQPRDIEAVRQEVLRECSRPSFCTPDESKNGSSLAIYRVPRGGGNIQGPTIRFAEMLLRCWRYLSVEVNPMGEDDTQRLLQVVCTDYQSCNFTSEMVSVPKRVERKRTKSGDIVVGQRVNSSGEAVYLVMATDDELAMKTNALVSKARRNLILQAVPAWLIEEGIEKVRETARTKDAQDPDSAKRKIYDAFATLGVTAEQLTEYLGHSNRLSPAELEDLRGYFAGIREGYTTWAAIIASKEDSGDGDKSAERIEALFGQLDKTPAQVRQIKAKHVGNAKALIEWLEKEVAKKANDGGQQQQTKVETQREEPKKEATEPAARKAEPQSDQEPAKPKEELKKAAPAAQPTLDTDGW